MFLETEQGTYPVFMFSPRHSFKEFYEWQNPVCETYGGEYRYRFHQEPRIEIQYELIKRDTDCLVIRNLFKEYVSKPWVVPVWSEDSYVGALSSNTTFVPFDTSFGNYSRFAFIYESDAKNEGAEIVEKRADGIVVKKPLINNYKRAIVMPAYLGFVKDNIGYGQVQGNTVFSFNFKIIETPPYIGKKVFPEEGEYSTAQCLFDNYTFTDIRENVYSNVEFIDNGFGVMAVEPTRLALTNTGTLNYLASTKAQQWRWKQFLYFLSGKYTPFYISAQHSQSKIVYLHSVYVDGYIKDVVEGTYFSDTRRFPQITCYYDPYLNIVEVVQILNAIRYQNTNSEIVFTDRTLFFDEGYRWEIVNQCRLDTNRVTLDYHDDIMECSVFVRILR